MSRRQFKDDIYRAAQKRKEHDNMIELVAQRQQQRALHQRWADQPSNTYHTYHAEASQCSGTAPRGEVLTGRPTQQQLLTNGGQQPDSAIYSYQSDMGIHAHQSQRSETTTQGELLEWKPDLQQLSDSGGLQPDPTSGYPNPSLHRGMALHPDQSLGSRVTHGGGLFELPPWQEQEWQQQRQQEEQQHPWNTAGLQPGPFDRHPTPGMHPGMRVQPHQSQPSGTSHRGGIFESPLWQQQQQQNLWHIPQQQPGPTHWHPSSGLQPGMGMQPYQFHSIGTHVGEAYDVPSLQQQPFNTRGLQPGREQWHSNPRRYSDMGMQPNQSQHSRYRMGSTSAPGMHGLMHNQHPNSRQAPVMEGTHSSQRPHRQDDLLKNSVATSHRLASTPALSVPFRGAPTSFLPSLLVPRPASRQPCSLAVQPNLGRPFAMLSQLVVSPTLLTAVPEVACCLSSAIQAPSVRISPGPAHAALHAVPVPIATEGDAGPAVDMSANETPMPNIPVERVCSKVSSLSLCTGAEEREHHHSEVLVVESPSLPAVACVGAHTSFNTANAQVETHTHEAAAVAAAASPLEAVAEQRLQVTAGRGGASKAQKLQAPTFTTAQREVSDANV